MSSNKEGRKQYLVTQDEGEDVRLLSLEGSSERADSYFLFDVETRSDTEGSFHHLVERYFFEVLGFPVALFHEVGVRGGSVDFAGIDGEGLVFIIEVKRFKDQRTSYDVNFQVLKYDLDPAGIRSYFFDNEGSVKKEKAAAIQNQLGVNDEQLKEIVKKVEYNLKNQLINPIIVVDKAPIQLLSTAYSIVLRKIRSEVRVVEMSLIEVDGVSRLWIRKYFSNNEWVGNKCKNNRNPTLASSLEFIEQVKKKCPASLNEVTSLLSKMESVAKASNGVLEIGYGSATANLYWQDDDGKFRFLALTANFGGRVEVWTDYLRKWNHGDLVKKITEVGISFIPGFHGQSSDSIPVTNSNVEDLCQMVEKLSTIFTSLKKADSNK